MSIIDNINQIEDDHTYSKHESKIMDNWKDDKIYEKIVGKNSFGEN